MSSTATENLDAVFMIEGDNVRLKAAKGRTFLKGRVVAVSEDGSRVRVEWDRTDGSGQRIAWENRTDLTFYTPEH